MDKRTNRRKISPFHRTSSSYRGCCPKRHILGYQNVYSRAEGIADHYWPCAVFYANRRPSEPAGRPPESAGRAPEPAGKASELAGRGSMAVGRTSESASPASDAPGRASERASKLAGKPAKRPSKPAGRPRGVIDRQMDGNQSRDNSPVWWFYKSSSFTEPLPRNEIGA